MNDRQLNGTITYFDASRGFGFITTAPEGKSYYFHISRFERGAQPVLEGVVEFEIAPPRALGKRPMAVNVRYRRQEVLDLLAGKELNSTGGAQ